MPASFPGVSLSRCQSGGRAREEGKGKGGKTRFASLLSLSRDPSRARPQFLVVRLRLIPTEIEAPEEAGRDEQLIKWFRMSLCTVHWVTCILNGSLSSYKMCSRGILTHDWILCEIWCCCKNSRQLRHKHKEHSQTYDHPCALVIHNHRQKQLRNSPKKTCFVKRTSFFNLQFSHFNISTPLSFSML